MNNDVSKSNNVSSSEIPDWLKWTFESEMEIDTKKDVKTKKISITNYTFEEQKYTIWEQNPELWYDINDLKTSLLQSKKYSKIAQIWDKTIAHMYGSSIKFLENKYSKQEILKFYKDNKKVLFKKWNRQEEELKLYWSEEKFIKIIESIIYSLIDENIEQYLEKLNNIFSDYNWSRSLKMYWEEDVNYAKACDNLEPGIKEIEDAFRKVTDKEFFYRYIFPKAILNDEKWHYYTENELKYIADLRFSKVNLVEMLEDYQKITNLKVRSSSMEEVRKCRKKSIEVSYIIKYLCWVDFSSGILNQMKGHNQNIKNWEFSMWIDKEYGSFFRNTLSMITGKDDIDFEYESPVAIFYFIKYIEPCMMLLGEILWDKELGKIKL